VCAGVWARTAGGRRSGSVSKRQNLQNSLGGGGDHLRFFQPMKNVFPFFIFFCFVVCRLCIYQQAMIWVFFALFGDVSFRRSFHS
jgi:hypothetical protein